MHEQNIIHEKSKLSPQTLKVLLSIAALFLCLLAAAQPAKAATIVASGTVNSTVTWSLDSEGTLYLTGTGAIQESAMSNRISSYTNSIKKVIISEGITEIGNKFMGSDAYISEGLDIYLPNSLEKIYASSLSVNKRHSNGTNGVNYETRFHVETYDEKFYNMLLPYTSSYPSVGSAIYGYLCPESIVYPAGNTLPRNYLANIYWPETLEIPSRITKLEQHVFLKAKIDGNLDLSSITEWHPCSFQTCTVSNELYLPKIIPSDWTTHTFGTNNGNCSCHIIAKRIYIQFTNMDSTNYKIIQGTFCADEIWCAETVNHFIAGSGSVACATPFSDSVEKTKLFVLSPNNTFYMASSGSASSSIIYTLSYGAWPSQIGNTGYNVRELYQVDFVDYDGTPLAETQYKIGGELPTVPGITPTRPADQYNTYTFSGWSTPTNVPLSSSTVFTAQYTATPRSYVVTFLDHDGSLISRNSYFYGNKIVPPAAPSRPDDAANSYTFTGWDNAVSATCTGDTTYVAQYAASPREMFQIDFVDWNGSVISSEKYYKGDTVVIPPDPVRAEDDYATYTFLNWTYNVSPVSGDMTYTARYLTTPKNYCIIYKSWNDSLLFLKSDYHYGDTVYVPAVTSAPPSDNEKVYVNKFSHWSTNADGTDDFSPVVTGNATYVAQFVPELIEYEITFLDYNGSEIETQILHYGDTVTPPTDPVRAADETHSYRFTGWDKPITAVEGNTTYRAVYESEYINYSVRFEDYNGTVLSEKLDYHYGDSVILPPNPTRAPEGGTSFSFLCWSPAVSPTVTGDAVYVAQYATGIAEFVVTFQNYNAYVISSDTYHYGDPLIVPPDPYRASDDTHTYQFSGWSPAPSETVTGNVLYIAQFTPIYKEFSVGFLDYDGTPLSVKTDYHYGDTVIPPSAPTRPSENGTNFYFAGWSPSFSPLVTGNVTYTATYTTEEVFFSASFLDHDGTPLSVKTDYHYGDTLIVPADPSRESDGTNTYTFSGWSPALSETVTANVTYTATYTAAPIQTPVIGGGGGGSVSEPEKEVHTNTVTPSENGTVTVYPPDAAAGDEVTITVKPNAGYIVGEIIVTDQYGNRIPVTDLGDGTHTFIQPDGPVSIYVVFDLSVDTAALCPKDSSCPLSHYSDVTSDSWYHDGVHYCLDSALMVGTSTDTFSPDSVTTRGQLATMLWSMAGHPAAATYSDFSDVEETDYYADAVQWITTTGIAAGYGNGEFGAEDAVTREQLAAILWRYAEETGRTTTGEETILNHADADQIHDYAVPAMQWAVSSGVILGDGTNLMPAGTATRAQVASSLRSFHAAQINSITD